MKHFKDLQVWQAAYALAREVYVVTKGFPKEETFGLTSQIRRAATSVPANIAEGFGRFSDVELRRFCQIACGSLYELETHLMLAYDLGYLNDTMRENLTEKLLVDARRLLIAFLRKLTADTNR